MSDVGTKISTMISTTAISLPALLTSLELEAGSTEMSRIFFQPSASYLPEGLRTLVKQRAESA